MAVFKQAPGMEGAGHESAGNGADMAPLASIDQIAMSYWPAFLGLALVLALLAFDRREASVLAAGVAVLLQATLVLSTQ